MIGASDFWHLLSLNNTKLGPDLRSIVHNHVLLVAMKLLFMPCSTRFLWSGTVVCRLFTVLALILVSSN